MPVENILAIDEGTTGVRALIMVRVFEPRWSVYEREERWTRWQRLVKAAIATAA